MKASTITLFVKWNVKWGSIQKNGLFNLIGLLYSGFPKYIVYVIFSKIKQNFFKTDTLTKIELIGLHFDQLINHFFSFFLKRRWK